MQKKEQASQHLETAWKYLKQAEWSDALLYARKANKENFRLVEPYFFEAANALIQAKYMHALSWFQKVKILFPNHMWTKEEIAGHKTAFWREIVQLLRENCPQQALKLCQEAIQMYSETPIFWLLKAKCLEELQCINESYQAIVQAYDRDPYSLETVQIYRKHLFQRQEYRKAYEIWKKITPEKITLDSQNYLCSLYKTLKACIEKVDNPTNENLLELAQILEKIGWEKESLLVYQKIPHQEKKIKELESHLCFLKDMKILFQNHYKTLKKNTIQIFDDIAILAKKNNIDVNCTPSYNVQIYYSVVREPDVFFLKKDSLMAYLARYNKIFDISNNYGYVEARLMNKISHTSHSYQSKQYQVIVGDETIIDHYVGYQSATPRVAGRTFMNQKGFYIALDTIRPNKKMLEELQKILQTNTIDETFCFDNIEYHQDLHYWFLKKSYDIGKSLHSEELYIEFLERSMNMVHFHELGHVIDFPCFIPFHRNIPNLFRTIYKYNFSVTKIHTRFETIAELFGLANSQYPYFYLAQLMQRLNVQYESIFQLVPWAWYGKMPQEDPYYLTSYNIYLNFQKKLQQDGFTIVDIPNIPRPLLQKYLKQLLQDSDLCKKSSHDKI
ncbi:MAG TPA: hypothetical protein P5543_02500 [Planctomycetota bacterium]|nr:hypothetical protein [Planctomycetota bacterium]HRU51047.1 hypothetical protein [Planctomycetota bacterium]